MVTLYFEEVAEEEEEIINKETIEAVQSSFRVKQLSLCPHPIGGGASLTLIGNKAYIFGGCSREGVPANTFSYFDFGEFELLLESFLFFFETRTDD